MFGLSPEDLERSLLDCPGGAASFAAEVRWGGGRVVSVDPAYRLGKSELAARARADVERGTRYVVDHAENYEWGFFASVSHHRAGRQEAADRFLDDFDAHSAAYVAAALPWLPFRDRSFDLVLSSHLLFTYADRLSLDFHVTAIEELVRVSRDGVRIFPIVDFAGGGYDGLEALRRRLAAAGVLSEVRPVGYRFQPGATEMLVAYGTTT